MSTVLTDIGLKLMAKKLGGKQPAALRFTLVSINTDGSVTLRPSCVYGKDRIEVKVRPITLFPGDSAHLDTHVTVNVSGY